MALTKILFVALGAATVGASECVNATLASNLDHASSTDMAVDSTGTVWLTTINTVTKCPVTGKCTSLRGKDFFYPSAIAVDLNFITPPQLVYVSDFHGVSKCWVHYSPDYGGSEKLDCDEFGSGWNSSHGLALDHEGNVFVANNGPQHGVWKCSPSADCVLVGGSDHWPADVHVTDVGVDSEGNIYVTGVKDVGAAPGTGYPLNHTVLVLKCTSAGTCEDFGSQWDWDQFGSDGQPLGLRWTFDDPSLTVGPDDNVYISDGATRSRCSADGFCENIAFDGSAGSMAIDQNGIFYIAPFVECPHEPGCMQVELRKFCFDLPTDILQV